MNNDIALIVGTGLTQLQLAIVARSPAKTPYGLPSSAILTTAFGKHEILCIARHGEAHSLAPHEVNYRANLWALGQHGVRRCVALNVVGAIAADFAPTDMAVPDQLIDYTWGRAGSFGGEAGKVVHADFTEPFDPVLRGRIASAITACGYSVRRGVYGVMQGPRLETAAEIQRLKRDGCAMVGMTAMPEAVLARELGMHYAICALAVNYAAGREPGGAAIHARLDEYLATGMQRVREVLQRLVPDLCSSTV